MSVTWQERSAADGWAEHTGTGTAVLVAPRPDAAQPARDRWPFPDLALVRVTGADDVPCLWLGDREAGPRTPVGLHGWSVQTGELGIRHGDGELAGSDAQALLLAGSLPVGGLSGGPVLDLRHGSVIGVIKGRRPEEGVAVPVTALYELLDSPSGGRIVREVLRAHDLHHLRRLDASTGAAAPAASGHPDWASFQAELPGHAPEFTGITAELRTRLHGHLAQLPPPAGAGDVVHLVEDVKEQVRGERLRSLVLRNVRTWREGAGLLYGLRRLEPGGGGALVDLDAVLLYAAKVTRKIASERAGEAEPGRLGVVADWIAGQAAGHPNWAVGEAIRALLEGDGGQPSGSPLSTPPTPPTLPAPTTSLLTTATATAPVAHAPFPVPATSRTDVLVKVGAAMYDGRYPWSVQLIYDGRDVTPVAADDRGVRAEELVRALRDPLTRALSQGDHGEHLAAIEVFLPRRLFDLPVDEWQLLPEQPGGGERHTGHEACADYDDDDDDDDDLVDERAIPLGMRRTVVVRDVRRNALPPSPEWRRRWNGVQGGPLAAGTLHGRPPGAGHPGGVRPGTRLPFYRALTALGDACVPVYCGPVGSGEGLAAMKDALMAGHPVVLWRRDRHDPEDCGAFHRQAAELLAAARQAGGLHGPLRDLRIRLADPESARADGLRGKIAVLFDPPDRPPYGAEAMRPPPFAAPGG